jgi:hypothetical protein
MEKAYELKALGAKILEKAKADGLEIAEEAVEKLAKAAYFGVKEWAQESAALSETKVDDFIAPFYNYADQYVLPQIEKIDLDGDGS